MRASPLHSQTPNSLNRFPAEGQPGQFGASGQPGLGGDMTQVESANAADVFTDWEQHNAQAEEVLYEIWWRAILYMNPGRLRRQVAHILWSFIAISYMYLA